jgi:hypothetical protein
VKLTLAEIENSELPPAIPFILINDEEQDRCEELLPMLEPKSRMPKQYAPVKFGDYFNPNSVEGVRMRRRQAAAIRKRKEEESEMVELDARQAAEEARLAARSPLAKLWDRFFG